MKKVSQQHRVVVSTLKCLLPKFLKQMNLFFLIITNKKIKAALLFLSVSLVLLFSSNPVFATATITIVNADSAGEGLNDTTAFTAVVGNRASTLGQARLNALQHAANLLGNIITSAIDIKIRAKFDPLGGSATSATLASAGAAFITRDFTNAPFASTWYPIALAEKLAGVNIATGSDTHEINMTINTDVDGTTVLATKKWYYGFDSTPPGTDIDFISVAMHELLHGLGFSTLVDLATGVRFADTNGTEYDDTYMRSLKHSGATPSDYPTMTDAQRVTASISDTLLLWSGTQVSANTGSVTAGKTSTEIQMYAPTTAATGSSVSHFNTAVTPNEMMEPSYTTADHDVGLAAYLLNDIGWGTTNVNAISIDLQVTQTDSGTAITAGNNETYNLVVTNNAASTATEVVISNMIPAGSTYVSATPDTGACFQSSNVVTCHLGNLVSSGTVNIAIIVTLNTTGTNTNSVFVDSVNPDSPIANNANYENTTVDAAPPVAATPSPGGTKSCFIATAAYGSPMQTEVRYLRAFRDQYLLTNAPGRWFVKMYYRYSPALAAIIKDSESLRSSVRVLLTPLVKMSHQIVSKNYLNLQK